MVLRLGFEFGLGQGQGSGWMNKVKHDDKVSPHKARRTIMCTWI